MNSMNRYFKKIISLCYRVFPQWFVSKWAWVFFKAIRHGKPANLIYCIGDSHASFFSGQERMQPAWPGKSNNIIPIFSSFRLGAVLAYNLCNLHSTSQGREALFSVLINEIPYGSTVMLCFGEIDCRTQLVKQSVKRNELLEIVVQECVKRYFSVILEIKSLGYQVLIWNVLPSTQYNLDDIPQFPTYGSVFERNEATRFFNHYLECLGQKNNIPFISIYDKITDEEGLPISNFFTDPVHLSQRAMPFAKQVLAKYIDSVSFP
jgi:hypothetical protein